MEPLFPHKEMDQILTVCYEYKKIMREGNFPGLRTFYSQAFIDKYGDNVALPDFYSEPHGPVDSLFNASGSENEIYKKVKRDRILLATADFKVVFADSIRAEARVIHNGEGESYKRYTLRRLYFFREGGAWRINDWEREWYSK